MKEETIFQNKVIKFLQEQGCYVKNNWGGGRFGSKEGTPDLHVCIDGYFHGIELKTDVGVESKLQAFNMDKINSSKGHGYILRPTTIKKNKYPEYNYHQESFEEWKERWFLNAV